MLPWIFGSNKAPTAFGKPADPFNNSTFPLQLGDNFYFLNTMITPVTVSGLPTASTVNGLRAFVQDSTVAGSGNFGAVVAGGGGNSVPVYSDGTNWRIG